mmetsp:Transcript_12279/g.51707  ORF Transcript_12279/g.51707 Transcript_12279/m.51707 type:complete len:289 (-) Transcript_12279:1293-2159(-)
MARSGALAAARPAAKAPDPPFWARAGGEAGEGDVPPPPRPQATRIQHVVDDVDYRAVGNDAPGRARPAAHQRGVGAGKLARADCDQVFHETLVAVGRESEAVDPQLLQRRIIARIPGREGHERAVQLVYDERSERHVFLADAEAIVRLHLGQKVLRVLVGADLRGNVADHAQRVDHRARRGEARAALVLGVLGLSTNERTEDRIAKLGSPDVRAALGWGRVGVADAEIKLLPPAAYERLVLLHVRHLGHLCRFGGVLELAAGDQRLVLGCRPQECHPTATGPGSRFGE